MNRFAMSAMVGAMMTVVASAEAATYTANLSAANENPPTASSGTGSTTVIIDTAAHTLQCARKIWALTGRTRGWLRLFARAGWIAKLPGPAGRWTLSRDLKAPAAKTFQQQWRALNR